MPKQRTNIAPSTADEILAACHYRCCVCPEHRRISNIHHIDENPANNAGENLVGVCAECHADLHSDQKMRRNITANSLKLLRDEWLAKCARVDTTFAEFGGVVSWYYINVHRLVDLYKAICGQDLLSDAPHRFKNNGTCIGTLWHNQRSSLNHIQHMELRSFYVAGVEALLPYLPVTSLHLIETGAIDHTKCQGTLVHFSAAFVGQDIPDQEEILINGRASNPQGTLRRVTYDLLAESKIESCLLLDPMYYFSDSTFIHFSETGFWGGIGLISSVRHAVGSNDGLLLRDQLVITPIAIGNAVVKGGMRKLAAETKISDIYK